jgi:hypothetical protein
MQRWLQLLQLLRAQPLLLQLLQQSAQLLV